MRRDEVIERLAELKVYSINHGKRLESLENRIIDGNSKFAKIGKQFAAMNEDLKNHLKSHDRNLKITLSLLGVSISILIFFLAKLAIG